MSAQAQIKIELIELQLFTFTFTSISKEDNYVPIWLMRELAKRKIMTPLQEISEKSSSGKIGRRIKKYTIFE